MKELKHFIFLLAIFSWKVIPFKLLFRDLINKNSKLKLKVYKDFRYKGVMNVRVEDNYIKLYNPGYTTIENEIFWNKMDGWEKISIQIWKNLAEKSNFILDIGANTGIYSLIAYSVNTSAKIIAFEPVKRTYVLTKKNFELNQSVNISLITKAVSNVNGNAVFYDVPTLSQYSASLNEKMLESTNDRIQYEVETIRIDSMPEVINNKIDLIKLDVEMHEPEVLEGMIGLIERDKPTILIEILNEEIASKVESLIKDFGYIYFSIDEENRPERIEHIGKSKMYNLLLITKEKANYIVDLL